jgi:hypothetical protein
MAPCYLPPVFFCRVRASSTWIINSTFSSDFFTIFLRIQD